MSDYGMWNERSNCWRLGLRMGTDCSGVGRQSQRERLRMEKWILGSNLMGNVNGVKWKRRMDSRLSNLNLQVCF
jgi:hypothetical protein